MESVKGANPGSAADNLLRAAQFIAESKYVVVMTGAGMSVESGIPPFRGTNGLWTKYGTPSMDGYRQFRADPDAYWDRQINAQIDEHILELRESLTERETTRWSFRVGGSSQLRVRQIRDYAEHRWVGLESRDG